MVEATDTNSRTAEMVKLITQIGPEINEISRRLHTHKETVRYWYSGLLRKGFTVQASYDYEKLGMKRIVMLVDLDDALKEHAQSLFIAMNNLCYVVSYEKVIPEGIYRVSASVPAELVNDYVAFVQLLKEKGLFKALEVYTFESFRAVPMRSNFYNFETNSWDFDWSSSLPDSSDLRMSPIANKESFDSLDLLLLQELRIDATRSLVEIQANLRKNHIDVNYKTLDWHYRTHVLGRGLIKSYSLNWMGTRYSFESEKAQHKKHTYLLVNIIVRDITDNEKMQLLGAMNGLPFQWAEAAGRNYFTEFAFPSENVTEAFLYLEKALAPVRNRARYFIIDQTRALSFTVEPSLYDEATKKWKFDKSGLASKFESLILQIKSGVG
jgi:DNA-binding Lrp family transcriptional regulator